MSQESFPDHENRLRLAEAIFDILAQSQPLDKYQIKAELFSVYGVDTDKSQINSILYSNKNVFVPSLDNLPSWSIQSRYWNHTNPFSELLQSNIPRHDFKFYKGVKPRQWQLEAFEKWKAQGYRGIVEAVTGTGKTMVGILAAANALDGGMDVLVIVPGNDLKQQWYESLKRSMSSRIKIGLFDNGRNDNFQHNNIIVSTVQSAYRNQIIPESEKSLLIADEVHRYGSDEYSKALSKLFSERLGLTATLERLDDGVEKYILPYFRPRKNQYTDVVIDGCGYARGLSEGILAPFRVKLIGVDLTENEFLLYEDLDLKLFKLRDHLVGSHGCPAYPIGNFLKAVQLLSDGGHKDYIGTNLARKYLNLFNKRRELLANTETKTHALAQLTPLIRKSNGTLLFTQLFSTAQNAVDLLKKYKITAEVFSGKESAEERRFLLKTFRDRKIKVLASPKVLDEGVDVPEADLGIILAASQSRRQMIQRMGRVIRPKNDRRIASFIILYAKNTNEDPNSGSHMTFINEMIDLAEQVDFVEACNVDFINSCELGINQTN